MSHCGPSDVLVTSGIRGSLFLTFRLSSAANELPFRDIFIPGLPSSVKERSRTRGLRSGHIISSTASDNIRIYLTKSHRIDFDRYVREWPMSKLHLQTEDWTGSAGTLLYDRTDCHGNKQLPQNPSTSTVHSTLPLMACLKCYSALWKTKLRHNSHLLLPKH